MTVAPSLAAGISALGLDVDTGAQAKLVDYVELLDKWNRTHNLTAIRDRAQMVTHHLLDSLAVLSRLPAQDRLRLIDIGSGGGLPGIPIAIVRPRWHVTLLDSNHKKAAFLRQAAIELDLAHVAIVCDRAEDYAPESTFEVVIARAFSELSAFAAAARHLLAPGGRLVAMKGGYPDEELSNLPAGIRVVDIPELRVPGLEARRHLVIMEPLPA